METFVYNQPCVQIFVFYLSQSHRRQRAALPRGHPLLGRLGLKTCPKSVRGRKFGRKNTPSRGRARTHFNCRTFPIKVSGSVAQLLQSGRPEVPGDEDREGNQVAVLLCHRIVR